MLTEWGAGDNTNSRKASFSLSLLLTAHYCPIIKHEYHHNSTWSLNSDRQRQEQCQWAAIERHWPGRQHNSLWQHSARESEKPENKTDNSPPLLFLLLMLIMKERKSLWQTSSSHLNANCHYVVHCWQQTNKHCCCCCYCRHWASVVWANDFFCQLSSVPILIVPKRKKKERNRIYYSAKREMPWQCKWFMVEQEKGKTRKKKCQHNK